MAITQGGVLNPIRALEEGAPATWFTAQGDPQQKRKQWIASMKPKGRVTVDAGAAKALRAGSSLLVAGITDVTGRFGRGDAVEVVSTEGASLGQGLTRYDHADANRIKGLRSDQVEAVLGYPPRGPLVHRDDMAI